MEGFDLIWVRGGNTFVLRRVLADSGADGVLIALLTQDLVAYGGYSGGVCVLAPDLTGLEMEDDISAVDRPLLQGLGILDRSFVPHVLSPTHPESARCDALAEAYRAAGRPFWALRDGEVLVIEKGLTAVLK
jgi:dipeptidase E